MAPPPGPWPVGCEGGDAGLTPFLALLHDGRIRLPIIILELEETVQVLQVRYLPLQSLSLRLVLGHLLVCSLPQHYHFGLRLLPGQGDRRLDWGPPEVSGLRGVSLGLGCGWGSQPGVPGMGQNQAAVTLRAQKAENFRCF